MPGTHREKEFPSAHLRAAASHAQKRKGLVSERRSTRLERRTQGKLPLPYKPRGLRQNPLKGSASYAQEILRRIEDGPRESIGVERSGAPARHGALGCVDRQNLVP